MVISDKHRFIFLHSRKTGGSTITVALTPHLGQMDRQIGCWSDSFDHGARPNIRLGLDLLNKNSLRILWKKSLNRAAINNAHKHAYVDALGPLPEHAPADRVKSFVGDEKWRNYFKFCFVRNPYEKVVSDWKWRCRLHGAAIPFSDFVGALKGEIASPLKPSLVDNWPVYTIDDTVVADFVGRHERFEEDLTAVFSRLRIEMPKTVPRAKRSPKYDYRDYYDDDLKRDIAALFAKEIETFGYAF